MKGVGCFADDDQWHKPLPSFDDILYGQSRMKNWRVVKNSCAARGCQWNPTMTVRDFKSTTVSITWYVLEELLLLTNVSSPCMLLGHKVQQLGLANYYKADDLFRCSPVLLDAWMFVPVKSVKTAPWLNDADCCWTSNQLLLWKIHFWMSVSYSCCLAVGKWPVISYQQCRTSMTFHC